MVKVDDFASCCRLDLSPEHSTVDTNLCAHVADLRAIFDESVRLSLHVIPGAARLRFTACGRRCGPLRVKPARFELYPPGRPEFGGELALERVRNPREAPPGEAPSHTHAQSKSAT